MNVKPDRVSISQWLTRKQSFFFLTLSLFLRICCWKLESLFNCINLFLKLLLLGAAQNSETQRVKAVASFPSIYQRIVVGEESPTEDQQRRYQEKSREVYYCIIFGTQFFIIFKIIYYRNLTCKNKNMKNILQT